ncbi:matrixin family metalloprotease [Limosilactobacillus caviae]
MVANADTLPTNSNKINISNNLCPISNESQSTNIDSSALIKNQTNFETCYYRLSNNTNPWWNYSWTISRNNQYQNNNWNNRYQNNNWNNQYQNNNWNNQYQNNNWNNQYQNNNWNNQYQNNNWNNQYQNNNWNNQYQNNNWNNQYQNNNWNNQYQNNNWNNQYQNNNWNNQYQNNNWNNQYQNNNWNNQYQNNNWNNQYQNNNNRNYQAVPGYNLPEAHWPTNNASVYINSNDPIIRQAAITAINNWNSTGAFHFYLSNNPLSANIKISANNNPNSSFDGYTQTYFDRSNLTYHGQTQITLNNYFLQNPYFNYSFRHRVHTIMHELGHAIGLQHNSSDPSSLMYPNSTEYPIQPKDIQEVNYIYQNH